MTPERWQRIQELYHAGRDRAESDRASFLAEACAGDDALRREVQALLDQPVSTSGFIDFLGGPAPARPKGSGANLLGRRLGSYHVQSLLGIGGMGEVYRAHDVKLGRDVAIKVLPERFAADPDRLARFDSEARMLAALNHLHIGAIYGLEDADPSAGSGQAAVRALVLELVEGETLAERLQRGPVSVREALTMARQIADALDAAHQKGIVHRDLKPANVKITPAGVVKVLDFGLAKVTDSDASSTRELSQSPTAAIGSTRVGVILGTAAYMSPEQARGMPVDTRADIWAFGCVLYEMLTGRPPFAGRTVAETLAAILEREPDWKSLPAATPSSVRELLRHCLQKDMTRRVQNIAEARATIEHAQRGWNLWRVAAIAAAPVLAILLMLIGSGIWLWTRGSSERWARNTALPEIVRLIDNGDTHAAFRLIRQAEKHLPGDPQIERLVREHGGRRRFATTPEGAEVYLKSYAATDEAWELLGKSPLEEVAVAQGFYRYRVVKPGYEEVETTTQGWPVVLPAQNTAPPGMVLVPEGEIQLGDTKVKLTQYWLDRYEITNQQYKLFVDQEGYRKRDYWKYPFVKDGRILSWEEATTLFRDTTGRPGPSTWELGTYPEGSADHPVGGLSWYEAAAYAEFAGKSLPTVYHWRRVTGDHTFGDIAEHSNYMKRGPAVVGGYRSVALFGVYDLAGNVREWCWNSVGERRYAQGGNWNDPVYSFQKLVSQPSFDRDAGNGIRLAKYISAPPAQATAGLTEEKPRDYRVERPVPDELFRAYEGLYSYDRTDLNAKIESVEESEEYRKEKISFDAAYGNERMFAYLFLPKNASPPYQTVVYFPSMSAWQTRTSDRLELFTTAFWLRGGRAVMYPVYKGTYERFAPLPDERTNAHRDLMIQWAKDISRSIDYLETRNDIDRARLAYSGASYGTMWGPVMVHAGGRFKAAVWLFGGLRAHPISPESDPLNFLPRVKIPVLMINGRNDFLCNPLESQLPMFRLLGTPAEHKRHAVLDGGHVPTRLSEVYRHALDWLDKYLGPVRS